LPQMSLTDAEKRLIDCVPEGRTLNAEGAVIRAELLREIMLERSATGLRVTADPHGIRIRNATITGALDLELVTSSVSLELRSCVFDHDVNLVSATLSRLVLSGSRIVVAAAPAVRADRVTVHGDLLLDDQFYAEAPGDRGTVRLAGAHVAGRLSLRSAQVRNRDGAALVADGMSVGGDLLLDSGFKATGRGRTGAVRLTGTDIGGRFSARRATFASPDGPAIRADRLRVGGDVIFDEGFAAEARSRDGAVRIVAGQVGGQIVLGSGVMRNEEGPVLVADRLTADGGLLIHDGFQATGSGPTGAVRLVDARVGSQLLVRDAKLVNETGPALCADRMIVTGTMLADRNLVADGHGEAGSVRLVSATIRGQLLAGPASVTNPSGPALAADGLTVAENLFLRDSFRAAGQGSLGAVRIPGAQIGGQLVADDAELTNADGPALIAEGIRIDGDLLLQSRLTATGSGPLGTVRLTGARVAGRLAIQDSQIENRSGGSPILVLDGATLGFLWVDPASWSTSNAIIGLDGMTYAGLPALGTVDDWISVLRRHTPGYGAQPYQQLADAYRGGGREQDARRVLIAQQDDRRDRGLAAQSGGRRAGAWRAIHRAGLRIQKVTIGYGYRTWPAFAITLAAAAASGVLGFAAGHTRTHTLQHYALYRPAAGSSSRGQQCDAVQQIVFGIRAPFLADPDHNDCILDGTTGAGELYDGLFWATSIVTWASATLAVAGYTGVVRNT